MQAVPKMSVCFFLASVHTSTHSNYVNAKLLAHCYSSRLMTYYRRQTKERKAVLKVISKEVCSRS